MKALPYGRDPTTCPPCAYIRWQQILLAWDTAADGAARRAAAAGFTAAQVARLGGHSLRAGFVTEAFRAGADAHAIMRQTGHRSP